MLHTPYKPMKIDVIEGYDERESAAEKNVWKLLSGMTFIVTIWLIFNSFYNPVRSSFPPSLVEYIFNISMIIVLLSIFIVGIWRIRKINLLTIIKEDLEEPRIIKDRILKIY